jgi:hypothetical protein
MPKWEYYSEHWEEWEEMLGAKCMRAYRHPEGYVYGGSGYVGMPGGWVYVYPSVPTGGNNPRLLDKVCIPVECGWLEILCVMHEMRKKYGDVA